MTMTTQAEDSVRLLLHGETVAIDRRTVETGRVRVEVQTGTRQHQVDEEVLSERVEIERVAIGRVVEVMPETREEGDTTVIPVVEEIVVVERRLLLKEEIHLRRVRTTRRHRETVDLREQQAVVDRRGPSEHPQTPAHDVSDAVSTSTGVKTDE